MIVPFNDLSKHHKRIKTELDTVISDVIATSSFIRGDHVFNFETGFAALMKANHCVSCANGTDAIYIAIKALGIQPGDEVIVPAHSWISTSETVTQAGGTVVFCDTDIDSFTIDIKNIADKITEKTVGIIPVHLFGQSADMDEIMALAQKHNLWVVEDCAQAHLAEYKGQIVGSFGDAATFSFYPGKNLGAMGDAGAIICKDQRLAEGMAKFARHGGLVKGRHDIEGINSRMDGIQAAVLNVKLKYLKEWTARRQGIAALYEKKLRSINSIKLPIVDSLKKHVWHLFVIQHESRDDLAAYLKSQGIETAVNYPVALPFLDAYSRYSHTKEEFPSAFYHQSRILSLPVFPEMEESQVSYVCEKIAEYCS